MGQTLKTLLENEEVLQCISENEEMILEGEQNLIAFKEGLKQFVLDNPHEFIAENLEETTKNILVFSETALVQYMNELTHLMSDQIVQEHTIAESKISDYI